MPLRIDKRSARSAGIDRRVRLHEILDGVETDVAAVNG